MVLKLQVNISKLYKSEKEREYCRNSCGLTTLFSIGCISAAQSALRNKTIIVKRYIKLNLKLVVNKPKKEEKKEQF